MLIEVLGSGGAIGTPKPGCCCRVCTLARQRGVPYSRTGPSFYVHDLGLLVDTPEESRLQVDRAGLGHIAACVYSHWHPDHTMGRRVFEMNLSLRDWPPISIPTHVYLPQQVAADARTHLGMWEQLSYMQSRDMVQIHELQDGESFTLGGWTVRPFPLHETYVYAFLIEGDGRCVLIAPDELVGWQPTSDLMGDRPLDLALMPMGITEFDPFCGERLIPAEHPVLLTEATFDQTLDMVRQLRARRVVLGHIEEPFGLSYDDFLALSARLENDGLPVTFAYDGMKIEI
jgi:phosphoribosyl 1,2-cyclic phosphate phosphodiesterase